MELTVSLAQIDVVSGEPARNLAKAEVYAEEAARRGSTLICFPEMWTTGFNWKANEELIRDRRDQVQAISGMAKRHRVWINGSMLCFNEEGKAANTSILFNPEGEIAAYYRKIHLFSLMNEERFLDPGKRIETAETPWGKTGLAICYDIRFPELFRRYFLEGVTMVLLPAAFPKPRLEHWKVLLRARAIENQTFVVGTNRVGSEGLGQDGTITYGGSSAVVDPWGRVLVEGGEADTLLTVAFDMREVDAVREGMAVLSDRRPDVYELD
jgi:omega-amidase